MDKFRQQGLLTPYNFIRTSLYKVMVANEPFPMIIEITHNENWDITKVSIDHRDVITIQK